MKVTVGELVATEKSLTTLISQPKLPAKYQWRLVPIVEELKRYADQHNKLIQKYAKPEERSDAAGNKVQLMIVPVDKAPAYNKELDGLKNETLELKYEPIDVEDLQKEKDENKEPVIKLSAIDYVTLRPLVTGEPKFD